METRLKASPIQARTKGELKRLRKSGIIPISLQHKGEETRHLQMPLKPLLDVVRHHGESALIDLEIAGVGNERALIKDVIRDGVTHLPIQISFMKVVRGEPIKANVPIIFEGEPEPVAEGTAVLQPALEHVEVRCLPRDLPEQISLDVSQMKFGDILHVSDLPKTGNYEVLSTPETVVVSLASLLRGAVEEEPAPTPEEVSAAEEGAEEQAQAA